MSSLQAYIDDLADPGFEPEEKAELYRSLIDDILPFSDEAYAHLSHPSKDHVQDLHHADPSSFFDGSTGLETFVMRYELGKDTLIGVPQGVMVQEPRSNRPLIYTTMSTCSTLLARTDEDLYAAHISLSDSEQTQAVLDFFTSQNIDDLVAIVSTVPDDGNGGDKHSLARSSEYEALGIPKSKIIPFTRKKDCDVVRAARLVADSDSILLFSYDTRLASIFNYSPRYEVVSGVYDVHEIAFDHLKAKA